MDNPDAGKVIADYQRFGIEIPDELTPPQMHDLEWSIWRDFLELSTERKDGGPIPSSAIRAYAKERSGINSNVFLHIIRALDNAYLSHEKGDSKTFSREMMR